MTNSMFNPQPNYSGVTIQIANPAVYTNPATNQGVNQGLNPVTNPHQHAYANYSQVQNANPYVQLEPAHNAIPALQPQASAYPPQYYLNNYNYTNNGTANGTIPDIISKETGNIPTKAYEASAPEDLRSVQDAKNVEDFVAKTKEYEVKPDEPQDFSKSKAVIDDLDARAAAEAAEKKNSKQKRVVALTDEYIKSLENYLNNPNDEIRLMASKEILTRLDEDKDRYNDAALNALLNKMLQDPSKLIRVAALSAFASQLASGNDYTITLLHNIQQNPSADKEDVLQAADILLKMSAGTEVKNIPNPAVKETPENNKGQKQ